MGRTIEGQRVVEYIVSIKNIILRMKAANQNVPRRGPNKVVKGRWGPTPAREKSWRMLGRVECGSRWEGSNNVSTRREDDASSEHGEKTMHQVREK